MSFLFVFIDGLGLGTREASVNPLLKAEMPFLRGLFKAQPLIASAVGGGIYEPCLLIKAVDASLGIAGIPQSATGQTTLLTGVNASQIMHRHVSGFPPERLRRLIKEQSIFKKLGQQGYKAIFANTFTPEFFAALAQGKRRYSATTLAALAGNCDLLTIPELLAGQAVYQDLTNEQLRERGHAVPLISPATAGKRLGLLAREAAFTLFEYFQTDRAGHSQDFAWSVRLLSQLDSFLKSIVSSQKEAAPPLNILLVSDHGNIEDLSTKSHTHNLVPLIVIGPAAPFFYEVESLLGICPGILEAINGGGVY